MFNTETLFLIYHNESQVLEPDVPREQPVCPDNDVDRPLGEPLDRLGSFTFGLKTRQLGQTHGKAGVSFTESLVMLGNQERGGNQNGHLFAVLNGFESRAQRYLGFAVADVAGNEPIHWRRLFHVSFDLVNRLKLVGSFNVGKRIFQLALPGCVR